MIKTDRRYKIIAVAVFLAMFLVLMLYYSLGYQYHLYLQEQNQVFLPTTDWLSTYHGRPAWLGCLVGEWLTQYYYYTFAGPVILAGMITIGSVLLYIALDSMAPVRDGRRGAVGRVVPAVVTLLATVYLVFTTFGTYSQLSPVVCVVGGIALYFAGRPMRWMCWLLVPLAYWLFGLGAMLTAALLAVGAVTTALTTKAQGRKLVLTLAPAAVALTLVFATPAVLKSYYSLTYGMALTYPGMGKLQMPEGEAERTYAVQYEYYAANYDRAEQLALTAEHPNAVTAMYYYLIQAKKGLLPDSLLSYPRRELGTLNTIGENTPRPIINMMHDLYYELGDMMYAERAAMMANVFSPHNRNARMLKRLVEANLVSGDTLAAQKHLRILQKMPAYRQWAQRRDPYNMDPDVQAEIDYRHERSNAKSNLRHGDNCRNIILELLESNASNIVALDYLLCTDLLLKDIETFKRDYDRYCIQEGAPRLKPLYQEALAIYLAGTGAPQSEWQRYIGLPDVMPRFLDYNNHRGDERFKGTYWYYFDKESAPSAN